MGKSRIRGLRSTEGAIGCPLLSLNLPFRPSAGFLTASLEHSAAAEGLGGGDLLGWSGARGRGLRRTAVVCV